MAVITHGIRMGRWFPGHARQWEGERALPVLLVALSKERMAGRLIVIILQQSNERSYFNAIRTINPSPSYW